MPWARLDDRAMNHPKILALSDSAFRLWIKGLVYCQIELTDGIIPRVILRSFKAKRVDVEALSTAIDPTYSPLWEPHDMGFVVHDYLFWNESRDAVRDKQIKAKERLKAWREEREREKRNATGNAVSPSTVSASHVTNTARTKPNLTKPYISLEGAPPRTTIRKFGPSQPLEAPPETTESDALQVRAARLVERYGELYVLHRRGAQYRPRPNLDWTDALDLVPRWDDVRLEKLAVLVLTTDDKWISTTDRGFKIFALKASWADDKLREWEVENGVSA